MFSKHPLPYSYVSLTWKSYPIIYISFKIPIGIFSNNCRTIINYSIIIRNNFLFRAYIISVFIHTIYDYALKTSGAMCVCWADCLYIIRGNPKVLTWNGCICCMFPVLELNFLSNLPNKNLTCPQVLQYWSTNFFHLRARKNTTCFLLAWQYFNSLARGRALISNTMFQTWVCLFKIF